MDVSLCFTLYHSELRLLCAAVLHWNTYTRQHAAVCENPIDKYVGSEQQPGWLMHAHARVDLQSLSC